MMTRHTRVVEDDRVVELAAQCHYGAVQRYVLVAVYNQVGFRWTGGRLGGSGWHGLSLSAGRGSGGFHDEAVRFNGRVGFDDDDRLTGEREAQFASKDEEFGAQSVGEVG